jgi:hypothetical protein
MQKLLQLIAAALRLPCSEVAAPAANLGEQRIF